MKHHSKTRYTFDPFWVVVPMSFTKQIWVSLLQASSPGFPKLEELSLAVDPKRCQGMDDSDLERIVKNCTKLRLLDVRGCIKITDSGIVRVPAWDLEHLYLSGKYFC